MPPFDASVATATNSNQSSMDSIPPNLRSLNSKAMTSTTALAGTNGNWTGLITGDHYEILHGNEHRFIDQDRTYMVKGNQESTIQQDHQETTHGNYNQQTTGTTQRLNVGGTNEKFVADHSMEHKSDRHMEEPEGLFHVISENCETFNNSHQNFWEKMEIVGNKTDICLGSSVDLKTLNIEAAGVDLCAKVWGHEFVGINTEAKELHAKLKGLQGEIDGLKTRVSDAQVNIQELFETPLAIGIFIL